MGKRFVQPLIYLSDERYEHTPPYIFCPNMAQLYAARPKLRQLLGNLYEMPHLAEEEEA